jgi:hypothetical protein
VIPRFHRQRLIAHGGEDAVLDPRTNMRVGAEILKEYLIRAGSLEAGLQMYNGALDDPLRGYAQKVIAERLRLEQALPRFEYREAAASAAPTAVALPYRGAAGAAPPSSSSASRTQPPPIAL